MGYLVVRRVVYLVTVIALVGLAAACSAPQADAGLSSTRVATETGSSAGPSGSAPLASISDRVQTDAGQVVTAPVVTATPTAATSTTAPTPTPASTPTPAPIGVGGPTIDLRWLQAIQTEDGGMVGVVTSDTLNIRSAPRLDAPIVGVTYARHPITIDNRVLGDPVDDNPYWFQVGNDEYVSAALVEPLIAPTPKAHHAGHWVDINLTSFYAIAYDGDRPIYAAIIIAGLDDHPTPVGEFTIQYRVRNETMDSATVGVPKGQPGYYYLPNVQYTQYFAAGGYALHGNYWSQPWQYGGFGSHGCINLMNSDAAWFWSFLADGSAVSIHY